MYAHRKGVRFPPRALVDGQAVAAHDHGVLVVIVYAADWTVDFANRLYAETASLTRNNTHTLIRVDGGIPGAAARKKMAELQDDLDRRLPMKDRRIAVMTDSAFVRGAMTAMGWITGDQLSGFATKDIEAAAEWIGGAEGDWQQIAALYHACSSFPR